MWNGCVTRPVGGIGPHALAHASARCAKGSKAETAWPFRLCVITKQSSSSWVPASRRVVQVAVVAKPWGCSCFAAAVPVYYQCLPRSAGRYRGETALTSCAPKLRRRVACGKRSASPGLALERQ